jgi:hypothetical protein
MLFEILVAVGGYYAYRHFAKGGKTRSTASRKKRRSDAIGAAGEAAVQAKLRKTLYWLCGNDFYLHEGPLVIEHAPGTDFPTAEIDHLAVTHFGVFIFETKNWSGHIALSDVPGKLTRTSPNGQRDDRRSPIAQNRTKVGFLRNQLPPGWPVHAAGLFTSGDAVLDPRLAADLISLDELPLWLQIRRDAFEGTQPISIEHARAAILIYADGSAAALERHQSYVSAEGIL